MERILDEQGSKYLVKWRGYPEEEATWEPRSNLAGCNSLLKAWAQAEKPSRQ